MSTSEHFREVPIQTHAGIDRSPARLECLTLARTRLGECPLWDHRRQRLLWIDSLQREIHAYCPASVQHRCWTLPSVIGSIGLASGGGLVAGLDSGFALVDIDSPDAVITPLTDPEATLGDTRLNDGKVDRAGRYWCGSMNTAFARPNASLYRLDPDGEVHRMDTGFTVSNGIAFSPDSRTLYFSDSRVDRAYVYDYDLDSGRIEARRAFTDTSRYQGRIDGATCDTDGNYWGALFDGGAIACFRADGTLLHRIELPVSCPTMCSFGGDRLDVLYVTSATFSMTPSQLADEPHAGHLFALHGLGVTGLPEPEFDASHWHNTPQPGTAGRRKP